MNSMFTGTSTVAEAAKYISSRLAERDAGSSEVEVGEHWRLHGIGRCLRVLQDSSASLADRGVILRELARLAGGTLSLPMQGSGIAEADWVEVQSYGITVRPQSDGHVKLLLLDDDRTPDSLKAVLRLDPYPRRPYTPEIPDAILQRLTSYGHYQTPTQKAAIRSLITMPPAAVLSVTMPTGSGKSLLFQFGTLWWRTQEANACTVVIVPTIALALDHERSVRAIRGLEGCRALTGDASPGEQGELLQAFNRGEVPILFLSPELALGRAQELLREAAKPQSEKPSAAKARLVAVFIDEAHIVQSWGRSFRPNFQRLPAFVAELRRGNNGLRVVLLSATLGGQARKELQRGYGKAAEMLEVDAQVARYELDLVSLTESSAVERDATVMRLMALIPRPCILYTNTIERARSFYDRLSREKGYHRIALFTGEIDDTIERRRIVTAWSEDKLDIVVATSAFGLGIDKQDVRAVVHACIPESTARYYQEIGRAGRDGHQALALCIWHREPGEGTRTKDDRSDAYRQATGSFIGADISVARWRGILKETERTGGYSQQHGKPFMSIPLDALRDGLVESFDYNRRWNMTVLNLLQRASVIQVNSVEYNKSEDPVWCIEVRDVRVMEHSPDGEQVLREAFALGQDEQAAARVDVKCLIEVLGAVMDGCRLAGLFQAVEEGHPVVQECGRCDWCRRNEVPPPEYVPFKGLASTWAELMQFRQVRIPPGKTVIRPATRIDGAGRTLTFSRLADAGIEQFIVPDGWGRVISQELTGTSVRAGFVLEIHHLLDGSGWAMVGLPTAIVLTEEISRLDELSRRWEEWCKTYPRMPLMLLAPPGLIRGGKPLEQSASPVAPYEEAILDTWVLTDAAKRAVGAS